MNRETIDPVALLGQAADVLRSTLPATWQVTEQLQTRSGQVGSVQVSPPGLPGATFAGLLWPGGRQSAASVARTAADAAPGHPAMVITAFANPALRRACVTAGVGFVDLTGWVSMRDDAAGLFISHQGAAKAPMRQLSGRGGPMKRLDGPGASRVIRTLWDGDQPRGVRALADEAQVSPGTASKVLAALAQHGAVERGEGGEVTAVDHRLLVDRWTQDYGVFTSNPQVLWRLAPRGTHDAYAQLLRVFADQGPAMGPVAVTGYMGAVTSLTGSVVPVIPHDLLAVYCADPDLLSETLRLRPADPSRANVVLVRPKDPSLLPDHPGGPWPHSVHDAQVVADLMTMGGRHPELAEQLLSEAATEGARDDAAE